ncbi:DMT family transporter [Kytococcus sp. Marseille-QA3725]
MTPSRTHPAHPGTGALLLVLGMVMSGTVGFFVVESGAPVGSVVFWRCAIGAAGLLAVVGARARTRAALHRIVTSRDGLVLAASGVLLVANWLLLFSAYDRLSIGVATVIFHVEPFLLIGLGVVFLGERVGRRTLAWAGLGLLGVVLVARPWDTGDTDPGALWIGIGLTLLAATLYAGSIVVMRSQQHAEEAPHPLVIVTVQLLAGALVTSPALALQGTDVTPTGWGHLTALGLVDTALMYLVIYTAYPRLGTPTIAVLAYVYPAAAVVVDRIAYGTPVTAVQLAGFAAIAAAGIGQGLTGRRDG